MPRANRYFLPGYIWHITHQCHKREFLLKFTRDKKRWLYWLFESKKRYGLRILNYCVTSNHIHLLVIDSGEDVIAQSMQLIAGRVAQEYNQRKRRGGAFWEDRYHATAVMQDEYLFRCLQYIDLNMNRAGVVNHPAEYQFYGYNEIINPPSRYAIIDRESLKKYCGYNSMENFVLHYKKMIDMLCNTDSGKLSRAAEWSNSVAVGCEEFILEIRDKLGVRVKAREIIDKGDAFTSFTLKEPQISYNNTFEPENDILSCDNRVFWNEF